MPTRPRRLSPPPVPSLAPHPVPLHRTIHLNISPRSNLHQDRRADASLLAQLQDLTSRRQHYSPARSAPALSKMEDLIPTIVVLVLGFAIYRWFFKSSECLVSPPPHRDETPARPRRGHTIVQLATRLRFGADEAGTGTPASSNEIRGVTRSMVSASHAHSVLDWRD